MYFPESALGTIIIVAIIIIITYQSMLLMPAKIIHNVHDVTFQNLRSQ